MPFQERTFTSELKWHFLIALLLIIDMFEIISNIFLFYKFKLFNNDNELINKIGASYGFVYTNLKNFVGYSYDLY